MSDTTNETSPAAAGESQLREFVRAWRAHAEEHGLTYPEPKLCVENEIAVLRFHGQNISVSHWSSRARIANVAEWMTDEALAHWTPLVLTDDMPTAIATLNVADVLDRRIPW